MTEEVIFTPLLFTSMVLTPLPGLVEVATIAGPAPFPFKIEAVHRSRLLFHLGFIRRGESLQRRSP
jgi:hypothetical protein